MSAAHALAGAPRPRPPRVSALVGEPRPALLLKDLSVPASRTQIAPPLPWTPGVNTGSGPTGFDFLIETLDKPVFPLLLLPPSMGLSGHGETGLQMITGVPQVKASSNRRAWASEVTRDPSARKGRADRTKGHPLQLPLAGCVGESQQRYSSDTVWPDRESSCSQLGQQLSPMPAVLPLPAVSFTCPMPGAGERPSAGPGEHRRQAYEREARGPALTEPAPAHPVPRAGIWGAAPRQMGNRALRDQEVFSGQGGSRTTIQQCRVALTLCRPLWPSLCACRKYLRDADRQVLAQRAFILTVKVLEDTLSELSEVRYPQPPSSPRGWPQSHHSHTSALRQIPLSPPVKHSFLPPHWGRSAAVQSAQSLNEVRTH